MNVRPPPATMKCFGLKNEAASYPLVMPLFNDFIEGLAHMNRELTAIKESHTALGLYYLTDIILCLPQPIS